MPDKKDETVEPEIVEVVKQTDVVKHEEAIEQLDRRNALLQRALALSISQTNKSDWVNLGGKPYLEASGSHKVARLWGIGITNVKGVKVEDKDEKGAYYRYKFKGDFSMRGEPTQEVIGTCSSRDLFFGQLSEKKDKQSGEVIQEKRFKELWEIDENNIEKKAYTNCINNGIKQFTGMKDVSWEEVNKYAKGSAEIDKVSYQGGKQATEGDKKSDEDKFVQIDKWIDSIAFFQIKTADDGEMEIVEVKDEKVKNERKVAIYQSYTKFKTFPGFKNVDEVKAAIEKNPTRMFPIYKSIEKKYSEFKETAEKLGVEGL